MENDKQNMEQLFRQILEMIGQDDGWCNLADFGGALRHRNIKYGKLIKFLKQYEALLEIRTDEKIDPPVKYVRLKQQT
ncbi:hypothetical protein EMN47_02340 [Prolixibacteraceae bacterium JC049]|nr:hypothetical protein [Prolixibacteraceae bacterium JC049]